MKTFTNKELGKEISGTLPKNAVKDNIAFITNMHGMLKDDGMWAWPVGGRIFKKLAEGWQEVK